MYIWRPSESSEYLWQQGQEPQISVKSANNVSQILSEHLCVSQSSSWGHKNSILHSSRETCFVKAQHWWRGEAQLSFWAVTGRWVDKAFVGGTTFHLQGQKGGAQPPFDSVVTAFLARFLLDAQF